MNTSKPLAVALGLLVTSGMLWCSKRSDQRSVGPVKFAEIAVPPKFSRDAATGLFVGVQKFPHDETLTVRYAVDDAVDLAYRFSLDQRVGLIPPRRTVLMISGTPEKDESKERLRKLRAAGARILNDATTGDILHVLKEQASLAGTRGLFVLSLATHGFQHDGDAYILGSTSDYGSPETALRIASIREVAAYARRSLLFIDACRERIDPSSRAGTPDPAAAAPHIRRMAHVQGQAIFYAAAPGEYAFDGDGNGVFTKAVLDGLNCEASSPKGTVLVETLHPYVDRQVRRWIREHKHRTVNPATQISMEGETRIMPLSECWRPPGPRIRVSFDGTTITTYGEDTRPLWRKDLGAPIIHAEAADLDADARYEVVIGLSDRITVLDRDGNERWNRNGDAMTLRTFTIGDLYEKHTNQIVAIWHGAQSSRLTVLDSEGQERSTFDYADPMQHVAIGRPTNMHAPKIVVATNTSVLVLHAKKLDRRWQRTLLSTNDAVKGLEILDTDHDHRQDIAVVTRSGTTSFTFDGRVVRQSTKGMWREAAVR